MRPQTPALLQVLVGGSPAQRGLHVSKEPLPVHLWVTWDLGLVTEQLGLIIFCLVSACPAEGLPCRSHPPSIPTVNPPATAHTHQQARWDWPPQSTWHFYSNGTVHTTTRVLSPGAADGLVLQVTGAAAGVWEGGVNPNSLPPCRPPVRPHSQHPPLHLQP